MFEYCASFMIIGCFDIIHLYFMIIGYFDNILFDLFLIKRRRKQYILQKKARKENLHEEYVISKTYIISLERKMKKVTTKGDGKVF